MAQRRVVLVRPTRRVGESVFHGHASSTNTPVDQVKPRRVAAGVYGPLKGGLTHPRIALKCPEQISPKERRSLQKKLNHAVERGDTTRASGLVTLLNQIDLLSANDRKRALDHLALRQLETQGGQNPDLDMWSSAVHWALERAIASTGGESYGLLLVRRQVGSSANWRPVEAFMADSGLVALNRAKRNGVYVLLAQLLVDHAEYVSDRSGAPLSAKLVAQCAGNVAGLFEQQFPGYLAAGLASFAAEQMASTVR